jgi:hypothetical protein
LGIPLIAPFGGKLVVRFSSLLICSFQVWVGRKARAVVIFFRRLQKSFIGEIVKCEQFYSQLNEGFEIVTDTEAVTSK